MGSSANHNLDETAVVGRSLQKLLIFFMVLDAVFLVFGGSFFGSLMSFIFHFIVLTGVQRRRTGVLLAYVVLNVIMLTLGAVCLLFVVGALMTMDDTYYNEDTPATSSSGDYSYTNMHGVKSALRRNLFSLNSLSSSEAPSSDSTYSTSSDSYEASSMMLAASILLLISVILLYCKIYSVVLAARLRRLLLASPVLPVHIALPVSGVNDHAPEDSKPLLAQESATFDDTNPVFTQPGFVPMQPQLYYPNMQGAPAMMPAPFMYGQHPVFYTFAPTNEKQ